MSIIAHAPFARRANLARCCIDIEIDTQISGWHTQTTQSSFYLITER